MKRSSTFVTVVLAFLLLGPAPSLAASSVGFHSDRSIENASQRVQSSVISFPQKMDHAVLSWNALAPEGGTVTFQLRAKIGKRWTPWYTMGVWGDGGSARSVAGQEDRSGKVDVDTLVLKEGAREWQYRLTKDNPRGGRLPFVSSVSLAVKDGKTYQKGDGEKGKVVHPLTIPAISQFETSKAEHHEELAKRICSPSSSAMVLRSLGAKVPSVTDYALGVYDPASDMFGNWPLNTAGIYRELARTRPPESVATYVRWYETFDELLENVERGVPVIVSIKFKEGELDGAPIPTPGHLVVVRGADEKHVYVNDPAAASNSTVPRRYKRVQFINAWKGMAYVVE